MGTSVSGRVEEGPGPGDTDLCFHCPRSLPSVCARACVCSGDREVPPSLIFDSLAQPPLFPTSKVSFKQSRLSSVKTSINTAALTMD